MSKPNRIGRAAVYGVAGLATAAIGATAANAMAAENDTVAAPQAAAAQAPMTQAPAAPAVSPHASPAVKTPAVKAPAAHPAPVVKTPEAKAPTVKAPEAKPVPKPASKPVVKQAASTHKAAPKVHVAAPAAHQVTGVRHHAVKPATRHTAQHVKAAPQKKFVVRAATRPGVAQAEQRVKDLQAELTRARADLATLKAGQQRDIGPCKTVRKVSADGHSASTASVCGTGTVKVG